MRRARAHVRAFLVRCICARQSRHRIAVRVCTQFYMRAFSVLASTHNHNNRIHTCTHTNSRKRISEYIHIRVLHRGRMGALWCGKVVALLVLCVLFCSPLTVAVRYFCLNQNSRTETNRPKRCCVIKGQPHLYTTYHLTSAQPQTHSNHRFVRVRRVCGTVEMVRACVTHTHRLRISDTTYISRICLTTAYGNQITVNYVILAQICCVTAQPEQFAPVEPDDFQRIR